MSQAVPFPASGNPCEAGGFGSAGVASRSRRTKSWSYVPSARRSSARARSCAAAGRPPPPRPAAPGRTRRAPGCRGSRPAPARSGTTAAAAAAAPSRPRAPRPAPASSGAYSAAVGKNQPAGPPPSRADSASRIARSAAIWPLPPNWARTSPSSRSAWRTWASTTGCSAAGTQCSAATEKTASTEPAGTSRSSCCARADGEPQPAAGLPAGRGDHVGVGVHPEHLDAVAERGQPGGEVADAAADVEHPRAGGSVRPREEVVVVLAVVRGVGGVELGVPAGHGDRRLPDRQRRRQERRPPRLVRVHRVGVRQRQADVVEPVEQPPAGEVVELEADRRSRRSGPPGPPGRR